MIILTKNVYELVVGHALSEHPIEACGILAGLDDKASEYYPIKNLDGSRISYFMDPRQQLETMKKIRSLGLRMTGIFHSHTESSCVPSGKDVKLAFYPEVSYLIVSLLDVHRPVLRSYKIKKGKAIRQKVAIV